tara:strand:+ start:77 stop:493 length:417 start_codon:yes stop_codon:yes gene_type:complete
MNIVSGNGKTKKFFEQFSLFFINGLFATCVHFFLLFFLVNFSTLNYGFSNFYAFLCGSISSFLGNKFIVFKYTKSSKILLQILKFSFLYLSLAIGHGIALYWWSDINSYNYIIGFILIALFNLFISFSFNKYLIFNAK